MGQNKISTDHSIIYWVTARQKRYSYFGQEIISIFPGFVSWSLYVGCMDSTSKLAHEETQGERDLTSSPEEGNAPTESYNSG